jgi:hypothetical protein
MTEPGDAFTVVASTKNLPSAESLSNNYKANDLLTMKLGGRATKPGRSMWRLRSTGKHTVSVSEDNSSLTIIFTRSIEGTSNRVRHWNIMKKSRLDITR